MIGWLLGDGRRLAEPGDFLAAFGERLRALGVAVSRVSTGVPILHPQVYSFSGLWEHGKGTSERLFRTDAWSMERLANSPIKIAYGGGGPVRCDPTRPPEAGEFEILADLRRAGLTDYVALSVPFSDGSFKSLSLATDRPGGFRDAEIALFEAIMPAFALVLEVQALRRTARTLLDVYVGPISGSRVLAGEITRGSGETIRAAIWLCDLRGFTPLTESLPSDALIAMLNAYFGAMCDAVTGQGGEVLKFIGDAMLAIFPIAGGDAGAACRRALEAARAAEAALAQVNARRAEAGEPPIDYGIALHVGEVLYGNIGGETRLDFTVIGASVNLAARIEGLCGELKRPILMSGDFARAAGAPATPVGAFDLKGVGARQDIFAPAKP